MRRGRAGAGGWEPHARRHGSRLVPSRPAQDDHAAGTGVICDRHRWVVVDQSDRIRPDSLQTRCYLVRSIVKILPEYYINIEVPVDRKSTRLNSSHSQISYAVFCLKKKKKK